VKYLSFIIILSTAAVWRMWVT